MRETWKVETNPSAERDSESWWLIEHGLGVKWLSRHCVCPEVTERTWTFLRDQRKVNQQLPNLPTTTRWSESYTSTYPNTIRKMEEDGGREKGKRDAAGTGGSRWSERPSIT